MKTKKGKSKKANKDFAKKMGVNPEFFQKVLDAWKTDEYGNKTINLSDAMDIIRNHKDK